MRVQSGIQEMRLVGGTVMIDNDEYKKFISIVNSTDKSTALTMSIGLYAKKRGIYSIMTTVRNKHYKGTLPDKIKTFAEKLVNFNMNINVHIKTIEDLKNKRVSFKDFIKSISFKDDGSVLSTVQLKLRALGNKLYYSYNIRDNWKLLFNPEANKFQKYDDFDIDAKTIYDAYMELFKEKDSSIISRETNRIIEALDKCEDKNNDAFAQEEEPVAEEPIAIQSESPKPPVPPVPPVPPQPSKVEVKKEDPQKEREQNYHNLISHNNSGRKIYHTMGDFMRDKGSHNQPK